MNDRVRKSPLSDTDRAIIDVLSQHGSAMTPKSVADADEALNYNYLRQRMPKLADRGVLVKVPEGYDLPERVDKVRDRGPLSAKGGRAPGYRTGETPRDPIYRPVAVQNDGAFVLSDDPIGYIEGEEALSGTDRVVFWLPVHGDAMQDTLPKGGLVPIQTFDPPWTDLQEDGVYLFRLEGTIQIKRLQRRPEARIRVMSDNDNYEDFDLRIDEDAEFEILGRVLI